jgi:transmembrane sensor
LKRTPDTFDIEAQAAQWLIRLEADSSPYTVELWLQWLKEDARHRAVFVRLESSWRQTDVLRSLQPIDGRINLGILDAFPGLRPPSPPQPPVTGPSRWPWWRRLWRTRPTAGRRGTHRLLTVPLAAAIVAGVATLGGWLIVMAPDRATHRTERGGFERVVLPDGSTALLNTNTEMRMHFSRERREIVLTRGEALFTVARDERRPFEVCVGDNTIRAVGTSFDVRLREPREIEVMVAQGVVAIDRAPGFTTAVTARSLLAAGDEALLDARGTAQTQHIGESDIERRLAWTRGQIWLSHTTLADAITEFNRYNSRQLVLGEPKLATLRVGGSFTTTDPTAFLGALERIFGIQARARAHQLILTGPLAKSSS